MMYVIRIIRLNTLKLYSLYVSYISIKVGGKKQKQKSMSLNKASFTSKKIKIN